MALLDTGATPNSISTSLMKEIRIQTKPTKRGTTVENGYYVNCKDVFKDVSVCFDNVTTTKEFLAV